ncbi:MAG: CapA family protein [Defluviitaleaceae bacterium]|nr:CapA family protein [Defluviitaleaceae bacterium]MCL2836403.1 CapA family protein [Defluviitaleaceae bacterium]
MTEMSWRILAKTILVVLVINGITGGSKANASALSLRCANEAAYISESRRPTMLFVGDIMTDGWVRARMERDGPDSVFPPQYRTLFQNADVVMGNLEMAVSERGEANPDKLYSYRGDPGHLSLLADIGVNIVSVANNHTLDFGRDAFADTLHYLTDYGIKYVGGGADLDEAMRFRIISVGDYKVAFLAASRVIPTVDWYAGYNRSGIFQAYDPKPLNARITLAKEEADYVVVYMHWGVMYNTVPEQFQRDMAYGFIDAGADLVLGAHPHVLQSFEFYKGKLIAYSLGNFIFESRAMDIAALEVTVGEDGNLSARLHPYHLIRQSVVPMTDQSALENLRAHLNEISFNAEIDDDFYIR